MKYVVLLLEPLYSVTPGGVGEGVLPQVLSYVDDVKEAERKREFIIKEDNLEPNNVFVLGVVTP